jgi:hypothetical protein
MALNILPYEEKFRQQWESLVMGSINGTFLHSRNFYDHNPANKTDEKSFLFFKKEKVVGVLPCNLYEKDGKRILHSYLRSTYGGFIINHEVGAQDAMEMVSLTVDAAKQNDVNEIVIRNPFRMYHSAWCDETDYAMWYHGFEIKSRELETAIKLGDYLQVQTAYDDSARRSIKKSRLHLEVKQSDDFETYWQVLEKNLQEKHGVSPTHNYQQFLNFMEYVGKDKVRLFVALKDGNIAAGIVAFLANQNVIHAQYIASDLAYQEFRPLNAVIDEMIRWGCEANFKYLNLGTSNYDGGRGFNEGLFRFKESFGGRNVLRETMHIVLK